MLPQKTHPPATSCKICKANAKLFGVCDLSKNASEGRGVQLPLSGIPIYYYRCGSCGFVFTRDFDEASIEDFKQVIYNDSYIEVDPDYESVRPAGNQTMIAREFQAGRDKIHIVDYGGGNGKLAAGLRGQGFSAETFDPFNEEFSVKLDRKANLIVSFEVMEHTPHPGDTFKEMISFLDESNGLLMFSTLLLPDEIDTVKTNWWYIAPRNGHVSIHSSKSLKILLGEHGYKMASANQGLHFAFREIPPFASHLIQVKNPSGP